MGRLGDLQTEINRLREELAAKDEEIQKLKKQKVKPTSTTGQGSTTGFEAE